MFSFKNHAVRRGRATSLRRVLFRNQFLARLLTVVQVFQVLSRHGIAGQSFQKFLELKFFLGREMQGLNFFGPAQERSFGIAATIVELDHIVQSCCLAITEIRSCFGYMAQALGSPASRGDGFAAKISVTSAMGIVAERAIDAEVGPGYGGRTNKCLVGGSSRFSGIGMR